MSWLHHLFLPHHTNNQRARLLHPSSLLLIIIFFLGFQVFLSHVSVTYPRILGYASQIAPGEIIRLTNVERARQGLGPLTMDSQLNSAAARKAADMFAKDYWAHVSPTGTQPWFFITDSGYVYRYAGENLARDFSNPEAVVQAWMNSSSHRDNLLNSHYQNIGVAVVDGRLLGSDTTLVVQMFGTRLAAAGSVSGSSFTVKAQENAAPAGTSATMPQPTPVPAVTAAASTVMVSPFSATKIISIFFLLVLAGILVADVVIVSRRKIVRWTSKSFAHLIFILILIVAAFSLLRGRII